MSDETKPAAGEGQAAVAEPTNPQGVGANGQQPPEAAQTEPSLAERLDRLEKQNQDLLKGMNAAQREASDARNEALFWQQRTQSLAGVAQPPRDEEAEAFAAWQESPFDMAAHKRYQEIHDRNLQSRMLQQVGFVQQRLMEMPRAQEILGEANTERASAILNAELQRPKTLEEAALLKRYHEGKLADWLTEDQKAREWRAKNAALTGPNGMAPAGHRVPGQPGTKATVVIPWAEWAAANATAKNELRKKFADPTMDYRITDVPEAILKRGFDPMKE